MEQQNQQLNPEQEIQLKVKLADVEVILNSLSQQPYAQVATLISSIVSQTQTQVNEQVNTQEKPKDKK